MLRIVDESRPGAKLSPADLLAAFHAGKPLAAFRSAPGSQYKVKAWDIGNGHLEVTAARVTEWHEADMEPTAIEGYLECVLKDREDRAAELRAKHAEQAARRAKRQVRQLCKAAGVDTLLTLTYRANMGDLDACKRHLKEFNRRMLRVLPDFFFIAAFERQERGAWHVHLATKRIPKGMTDRNDANGVQVKSYEVIRRIWRSVVGDLGGNIDVARRKYTSGKTAAQIASYIAGYIVKEFAEGEKWSNRWTKFGDLGREIVRESQVLGYADSMLDAIEIAYALTNNTQGVVVSRMDKWADWFTLHAEPLPRGVTRLC